MSAEVKHMENCECCQSFLKMEKRYDHLRGHPQDDEQFSHDVSLPTEAMCDNARGFIMGMDIGCRTWGAMQKHLDMGDYKTHPDICRFSENNPTGHITKWDCAHYIYQLMNMPQENTVDDIEEQNAAAAKANMRTGPDDRRKNPETPKKYYNENDRRKNSIFLDRRCQKSRGFDGDVA